FQIDRARKWPAILSRHEKDFVRLFVCRDERAEEIWGNAPAATADTRRGPRDCFVRRVLPAEHGREACRQIIRNLSCDIVEISWPIQFSPSQPGFRLCSAQNLRRKISKGSYSQ